MNRKEQKKETNMNTKKNILIMLKYNVDQFEQDRKNRNTHLNNISETITTGFYMKNNT